MLLQRLRQPRGEIAPAIIIEDNLHAPADGWVLREGDECLEAVEVWDDHDGMEEDRLRQQAKELARQTKLFQISAGHAAKYRHQELSRKRQEARVFAILQRQPYSRKAWAGARDVSATYEELTN
jgi:hypothetical protein